MEFRIQWQTQQVVECDHQIVDLQFLRQSSLPGIEHGCTALKSYDFQGTAFFNCLSTFLRLHLAGG